MTVTTAQYAAYTRVLAENSYDGDDLLRLLEEIVTGEWDNAVNYSLENPPGDPMDDFNYAGSRHHYWSQTNHTI